MPMVEMMMMMLGAVQGRCRVWKEDEERYQRESRVSGDPDSQRGFVTGSVLSAERRRAGERRRLSLAMRALHAHELRP